MFYLDGRSKRTSHICPICKQEFIARKERKFCSRKCYFKYRSILMKSKPKEEFIRRLKKGWKKRKLQGWNGAKFFTEESKRKISEKARERALRRWNNPEEREKWLKALKIGGTIKGIQASLRAQKRRPTKPERQIMEIISELNLPFSYTGNGKLIIERYNPDFTDQEQRKIIEVFGDYWHSPKDEEKKRKVYNRNGYSLLVIWQHELSNLEEVKRRIQDYYYGTESIIREDEK